MQLHLDSRPVGRVMVVQCAGRIVAGEEINALQLQVGKALPHYQDLVLQLKGVDFVDISGLGALMRLVSTARAQGGDLKLCSLPQQVRRVLEANNMLSLFEVYDSECEAIVAAYLGSHYRKDTCGDKQLRILCVYDSVDVRTFLAELLHRAGYNAITTGNVHDATILLKATKAKLVVLAANMQFVHGASTKQAIHEIDPQAELVVLDADFALQNPEEAVSNLLDSIRRHTSTDSLVMKS